MDNQQHIVGGFLQHLLDANPHIGRAIQNFVRGFTNQAPPREPSLPLDDPDLADMPPLEHISDDDSASREGPAQHEEPPVEDVMQSVGDLSLYSPPNPDSATQNQDPSSSLPQAAADEPSSQRVPSDPAGIQSVNSMPPHPSVSQPDADVDMSDAAHSTHQSPGISSHSSPQTGSRRARVDEEVDEEDMRQTNRQRMNSPGNSDDVNTQQPRNAQPTAQQAPTTQADVPNHPPPPYSRLIYTLDIFPGPGLNVHQQQQSGGQGAGAGAGEQQDQGHHHHPPLPMFNFTFQIPIQPQTGGAPPVANGVPTPDFAQQFFPFPPDADHFFMPFFPFGAQREPEADDPERAEKLIRGLEEVPMGLVQRIERLGGDDGDSLCSICWEKLSSEGGWFDVGEQTTQANATMDFDSSTAPTGASVEASSPSTKDLPQVVALPCSHVFHTSCLSPWFTKPHHTTCPSCRFDIDPESLTYVPPRQRRQQRSPASQTQGPAQVPAGAQPPESQGHAQPIPAQAAPQSIPATQPTVNAPHTGIPDATHGQLPRQGPPPAMPPELGFFFPMASGQDGQTPMYIPLDPQTTRSIFQRLFGDAPPAQPQPQVQPQPEHPQGMNAPLPGVVPSAQNPPVGSGTHDTLVPNILERMFGAQVPHMNANSGMGAAQQRPPNAAFNASRSQGRTRPPEKGQWTPPAPPGPTLRQRVERKERERGLRCWDVSCSLGPSDEDPIPIVDPSTVRQIPISRIGGHEEKVCEHTFHPACLVSAERVAGWGGEDKKEKEGEEEDVEVSCPVCRAVGAIPRTDWDEGACALV